jgi:hypothetical protein
LWIFFVQAIKYDLCFAYCIIWNKIIYILFNWQIWDLLWGI